MTEHKVYTAIGLMSGTSLDGVDVALIETDGMGVIRRGAFETYAYREQMKDVIRAAMRDRTKAATVEMAEKLVTDEHIRSVKRFIDQHPEAASAELIGFHGQTIYHNPADKITVQIGDGARLARETGINVVNDFRTADVQAGGQGAPLLPLYHQALAARLTKPVAILNIGGVANVTWIGADGILAFDTGPGNALIDDFIKKRTGESYDRNGRTARSGRIQRELLDQWMSNAYFARKPPKSLDRDAWDVSAVEELSTKDGAATLTAFTVQSILRAREHMPQQPRRWLVAGGGRHNKAIMYGLKMTLGMWKVDRVDRLEWSGDAMEAEGFAYLAVRSVLKLPLSVPGTTGVKEPLTGGVFHPA